MPSNPSQHRPFSRRGLTLIEIMIALTMTLIVLGAMMQAFQYASGQMQMGRATMEMANRLRSAEELLRSDLSNLTVEPRPYTGNTNPNGYLEIIDGTMRDKTNAAGLRQLPRRCRRCHRDDRPQRWTVFSRTSYSRQYPEVRK